MEILSHPFLVYQQYEPSLFRLLERGRMGEASGNTLKLTRFRSVRRDKAPTQEPAQMAKSNLSRRPTGVRADPSAKIQERNTNEEKAKRKKEREKKKSKEGRDKDKEKEKEKKKKVKIQI